MLNIPYVQDPSHGWAIVKRDLLPKIRLKEEDFPYSYLSPKENFIALEEDCEMPILLKALDAHQIEYNIVDRIVEEDHEDNPRNWHEDDYIESEDPHIPQDDDGEYSFRDHEDETVGPKTGYE